MNCRELVRLRKLGRLKVFHGTLLVLQQDTHGIKRYVTPDRYVEADFAYIPMPEQLRELQEGEQRIEAREEIRDMEFLGLDPVTDKIDR